MNNTNIPVQVQVELELEGNLHEYEIGIAENIEMSGGTNDYEKLKNKPQINGVELIKNKSFDDLGMSSITNQELEYLLKF